MKRKKTLIDFLKQSGKGVIGCKICLNPDKINAEYHQGTYGIRANECYVITKVTNNYEGLPLIDFVGEDEVGHKGFPTYGFFPNDEKMCELYIKFLKSS